MALDRDSEHFLGDETVAAMLGLSVRTLQRHLRAGRLTPPVRTSGRTRLWSVQEAEIAREASRSLQEAFADQRGRRARQMTLELTAA